MVFSDHSEYARDSLNEIRGGNTISNLEIIGLNETSINGQPVTIAQYNRTGCVANFDPITLSYFMATDDYNGYRLLYETDFRDKNSSERMPMIERMANSSIITK
jgi:hypothetical protein